MMSTFEQGELIPLPDDLKIKALFDIALLQTIGQYESVYRTDYKGTFVDANADDAINDANRTIPHIFIHKKNYESGLSTYEVTDIIPNGYIRPSDRSTTTYLFTDSFTDSHIRKEVVLPTIKDRKIAFKIAYIDVDPQEVDDLIGRFEAADLQPYQKPSRVKTLGKAVLGFTKSILSSDSHYDAIKNDPYKYGIVKPPSNRF